MVKKISSSSKRKTKKKNKKSNVYNTVIAVCVVVMLVAGVLALKDIIPRIKASKEINLLRDIKPVSDDILAQNDMNYNKLKEINNDYIFWLRIDDTQIDLPVVQTDDNDYYLTWTFQDEYNDAGTLFLDYRNTPSLTDQNSVIYGHARLDGTMFGGLKKFKDQSYYETHPFVEVLTKDSIYYYQIFSVNVLDATYDYRSPSYGEAFRGFINNIRSSSYITSSVTVDENSRIMTLSTCTTSEQDMRLVVFAVLLNADGSQLDLSVIPI